MDMPCIFGSVSGRERLKPFVPPSQAMEVGQGRLPGPHVSFTLHVGDLGCLEFGLLPLDAYPPQDNNVYLCVTSLAWCFIMTGHPGRGWWCAADGSM